MGNSYRRGLRRRGQQDEILMNIVLFIIDAAIIFGFVYDVIKTKKREKMIIQGAKNWKEYGKQRWPDEIYKRTER